VRQGSQRALKEDIGAPGIEVVLANDNGEGAQ